MVLVETVDLLSQCLKETEDQLMRENMVGKMCADLKPTLIDLEFLDAA